MIPEYIEITAHGEENRTFLDTKTDNKVKCLCPRPPNAWENIEKRLANCPIHGKHR